MKNLRRKEMERKIIERIARSSPKDQAAVKRALVVKTNEQLEQLCESYGIELEND
ncbi:MAG: hypothetical protein WC329_01825 [Candidatus Omnitrophota bacterium]|jgi:hypothetical protein|nr:hypothetical protein [Dehalococcoidales bacterium]